MSLENMTVETPIEALNPLTLRAYNALRNAGMSTVGDVVLALQAGNLQKVKNCGKKTIQELQSLLVSQGLYPESPAATILALQKRVDELEKKLASFNSADDSYFARKIRDVCSLMIILDREGKLK